VERSVEEELVLACRGGDKGAYASLVRAHARSIFAICLGMLGNVHDAEDAAQETFVRAFRQIGDLRGASQFRPWTARIARNLCLDLLRRRKRGSEALATHAAGQSNPGNHAEPHEARLLREEERHKLERALLRLPENYRAPLMLYYFDGHSTENVAKMLDLDPATVLTRLSRARRELRRMLQEQGGAQ
jgi:RNA polymerase sigma-70 factor, ECF subfamily